MNLILLQHPHQMGRKEKHFPSVSTCQLKHPRLFGLKSLFQVKAVTFGETFVLSKFSRSFRFLLLPFLPTKRVVWGLTGVGRGPQMHMWYQVVEGSGPWLPVQSLLTTAGPSSMLGPHHTLLGSQHLPIRRVTQDLLPQMDFSGAYSALSDLIPSLNSRPPPMCYAHEKALKSFGTMKLFLKRQMS